MTEEDSNENYRKIFNNLEVGYLKVGLDGSIIEHNKTLNILSGFDPSISLIGLKTRELWDFIDEQDEYLELLNKNGYVKNFVIHATSPKGKKLVFIINTRIVKDKDNNPLYIEGTFTDVSEGYVVDKKLRKSQERLKFLVSSSPAVIYTSRTSGDYGATYISENVTDLMGYEPDDFIKNSSFWIDHVHPDERERVLSGLTALYEDGKYEHEYRFQFKDGTYHWMLDDCNLIRDENDNPIETIGYWVDITKRKEIENKLRESEKKYRELTEDLEKSVGRRTRELKESEAKYRTLFEEALNPIMIVNDNGNYLEVNKAACDFLEDEKEEILKKKVWDYPPPGTLEKQKKNHSPFFARRTLETEYYIKGKVKTLLLNVVPFESLDKIYLWGLGQDITQRIITEQKLRESEKKAHEAYNRASFYRDLFAHDINNILQNILSASELSSLYLTKNEQKEKLSKTLDIIKEQTQKGADLISKVRKLSGLEDGQTSLESIEIYNILKNSIEFSKNSFPNRDINVKVDSSNENIFVSANKLISDVFENVLLNGITHNRSPKVEINIRISETQQDEINYIKLEFQDNGVGISDDQKNFIFQKRTDGYESGRGMGLGLSLVKIIIESYNGLIWVEDRVKEASSQGSNFIILIPKV